MISKSKDNTHGITLPKYTDTYTWYGKPYEQSVWGEQYLPASVAPIGSKESITYDGGPKTTQLVVGDTTLVFPVFKYCRHDNNYVAFHQGSGSSMSGTANCCGQTINYNRVIPGSPHFTWFNFFDLPVSVVKLGVALDHGSLIGAYGAIAPSVIKSKCLEDSKMLGFPDAFNVLNFILELRDVKRLPELLSKWKISSHDVSDKYLGTSFGLIPFFSDIMSIIERVLSNTALNKWDAMASKMKVLNAHCNIPPPSIVTNHPYFQSYEKGVAKIEARDIPYHIAQADFGLIPLVGSNDIKVTVRQEIKSKGHVYFIPKKVEDAMSIKAALWGVNKPLTAIWNALPYSFVIDWIADVGDLISEFERSDPMLHYRIVNAGYSVKVTTYVEIPITFTGIDTGQTICKSVSYLRQPISPGSVLQAGKFYPFEFTLPTGEQTLLGSALLHQLLK